MPKYTRYGLFVLLLALIALSLPLIAAAQGTEPTPVPTEAPVLAATEEPEATAEPIQLPGGTRIDPIDAGEISVGDTVEGELTDSEPAFVYTLNGTANSTVTITLVSEDFDPYLVLEDADGNLLDTDDDSAGSYDSRITYRLPADGEYHIIAQSFAYYNNSGMATGAYTLSVSVVEVRRIEYTQTVEGELTLDELTQDYEFTGSEGDTIVINLTSPTFDTYLVLLDESGFELMSNDDSGGTLNSQIGPYVLPYTGSYTIQANSFSRSATGAFSLSLQRVESQAVTYGEPIEIEVEEGSSTTYFFTFEASMGELINIYADSDGTVDSSLNLTDPYNSSVVSDQDSGRRYDPEIIDFAIVTSGTHTLLLNVLSGSGTITLTVERGVVPSLDDGPQRIVFSSSGAYSTRSVTFTGVAGQVVRLSFGIESAGVTGSPNVSVMQEGVSIAYASGSTVRGISMDFTVPSDGEVFISLSEYSYSNLSYEVSLEVLE